MHLWVSGFKRKGYDDFERFIEMAIGPGSTYIFKRWCQYDYLSLNGDLKSPITLNYVGRYENFADDFDKIANDIGIKERYIDLPVKNSSQRTDESYRQYYNDKTKKMVEKHYAKDLEYWGYKF